MATIYVSYRSTQAAFVKAIVDRLEPRHRIRIDYKIPGGAEWRLHQAAELRTSDTFLLFVSTDTSTSDFQNAEVGAATFCAHFVDNKTILPVCIDDAPIPKTLHHIDWLTVSSNDPIAAAEAIENQLANHRPKVKVFVSHAHREIDRQIASRLVDVLEANFHVPEGEVRCTSVPGRQLDLGSMASDTLRRELGSAACVIALLTPSSIDNAWVHFELGAAWADASATIPLLAGGLEDKDIPGAFRGMVGGSLTDPSSTDRLLTQVATLTGWPTKAGASANGKRHEFVDFVRDQKFPTEALAQVIKTGFATRRMAIGTRQGEIVDYIASRRSHEPFLTQPALEQKFRLSGKELYYRLDSLELRGFLARVALGTSGGGDTTWGWTLSAKYAAELGR